MNSDDGARIRVGVSACVVGREVRYDGGHKLDRFVRDTLGAIVELLPVCPELELGLGTPRETLRLVKGATRPSLIAPASGSDRTELMLRYAQQKVATLIELGICGFIVQQGSPSCGMARVRIYASANSTRPQGHGRGLFTQTLIERLPHLPIEEASRLGDPELREDFIARIFAYGGRDRRIARR